MSDTRIHPEPTSFTLTRVHPDGREEVVETTTDHVSGIEAGHRAMHLHPGAAFSLYAGTKRIAKFGNYQRALTLRPAAIEMMVGA